MLIKHPVKISFSWWRVMGYCKMLWWVARGKNIVVMEKKITEN